MAGNLLRTRPNPARPVQAGRLRDAPTGPPPPACHRAERGAAPRLYAVDDLAEAILNRASRWTVGLIAARKPELAAPLSGGDAADSLDGVEHEFADGCVIGPPCPAWAMAYRDA
jgi:hypothetical protein